jgi:hypothetical protein
MKSCTPVAALKIFVHLSVMRKLTPSSLTSLMTKLWVLMVSTVFSSGKHRILSRKTFINYVGISILMWLTSKV